MMIPKLADLRQRLREAPRRIRATTNVALTSGLFWEMKAPGIREVIRVLGRAHQNPSAVYQIHAHNSPDKPAVIWRDQTISWFELNRRIDSLAHGLVARGLGRKEAVLSMMRNRPEHIVVQNAVARASGSAVAVSWRSTPTEFAYLAQNCAARFIVFEHDLWPVVEPAAKQLGLGRERLISVGGDVPGTTRLEDAHGKAVTLAVDDEAAAVVTYTSGTTGKPKGAVRKFPREMFVAALEFIAQTPMRTDDVHLVVCPLYHMTAYGFLTMSHLLGATAVILDDFKPETFLRAVQQHHATSTALVPTMLHRLTALPKEERDKFRSRSLRLIFCGGAALTGQLAADAMNAFGDIVYNFYGATETGLVTLAKPADLRDAPGTIGKSLPNNSIRLIGEDKTEVAPGEVGELYVKSDQLVAGYHENAAATKESMLAGYFSVGDLARVDAAGRYFIEGRKRDMVITGGVNVYPAEVEATIEEHPSVFEAAVIGVEDPEWGERVKAFVVLEKNKTLDEAELKAWLRERLATPKVPREYVFIDTLPRNPTGKVLKNDLRR